IAIGQRQRNHGKWQQINQPLLRQALAAKEMEAQDDQWQQQAQHADHDYTSEWLLTPGYLAHAPAEHPADDADADNTICSGDQEYGETGLGPPPEQRHPNDDQAASRKQRTVAEEGPTVLRRLPFWLRRGGRGKQPDKGYGEPRDHHHQDERENAGPERIHPLDAQQAKEQRRAIEQAIGDTRHWPVD